MATYKFKALNTDGSQTEGVLEATSSQEAVGKVKEQGFFPVKIERVSTDDVESSSSPPLSEGEKSVTKCHSFGWKVRLRVFLLVGVPIVLIFALMNYLLFQGKPMWLIAMIGFATVIVFGIGNIVIVQKMLASFTCPRCHSPIPDWQTDDKRRVNYDCSQCGVRWDIGYKMPRGRYG